MNRKQKIIVSTTGIFLVLLILVGLTYAYFLTRINGNKNDKSISVTTANLRLVYSDGTDGVIGGTNIEPSDTVYTKTFTVKSEGNKNIEYGVYLINVINQLTRKEDVKYTLECTTDGTIKCNGVNETTFPSGISQLITNTIEPGKTHTYTFKFTYKDTGTDQSIDMGKELSAKIQIFGKLPNGEYFPYEEGTLSYNIINNAKNNLNGTEYLETPKTLPAQATSSFIYVKGTDPTSFTSSLSSATNYYISYADEYTVDETTGELALVNPTIATEKYTTSMANSLVGKYAVWGTSTPTVTNTQNQYNIYKISTNISDITSTIKYAIISSTTKSTEKELSSTPDDYGTSYYYRGGVEDNYVNFAGMCWKIVRIEGDGSTKLILEDRSAECNDESYTGNWSDGNTIIFGYDSNYKADFLNYSGGLVDSLMSFKTTLETAFGTGKTLADYLKIDDWCFDHNVASTDSSGNQYYDAYKRIYTDKSPSLKCTGTKLNKYKDSTDMYVGTLTADEIVFAGATDKQNLTYYLSNSYVVNNFLNWWVISSYNYDAEWTDDYVFILQSDTGFLSQDKVTPSSSGHYSRPSITLKTGIQISSGNGTKENPYIIKTS